LNVIHAPKQGIYEYKRIGAKLVQMEGGYTQVFKSNIF